MYRAGMHATIGYPAIVCNVERAPDASIRLHSAQVELENQELGAGMNSLTKMEISHSSKAERKYPRTRPGTVFSSNAPRRLFIHLDRSTHGDTAHGSRLHARPVNALTATKCN
eukprot:COSAG02_NODE_808_length_16924_cov_117.299733_4_plen_113_part_00